MKTQIIKGLIILSSIGLAILVLFYLSKNPIPREAQPAGGTKWGPSPSFEKFKTDQEFKDYLEKAQSQTGTSNLALMKSTSAITSAGEILTPAPDRVSETNVQVIGIDEPDIVKTDGKEIYLSSENRYKLQPMPLIQEKIGIMPPAQIQAQTLAIKAFPPTDLKQYSKIDHSGNLLLSGNILMVFENNKIYGYDVKNPSSPEKKWQIDLKDNVEIVGTRLYNNEVYFIAKKYLSGTPRCPIEILSNSTRCIDVYHPLVDFQADSVYTAVKFAPSDGNIEKVISFVGSASNTTIYMSKNSLYATYEYSGDAVSFYINFLSENRDLMPAPILDKIKKLNSYDISQNSKLTEFTTILDKYKNSLDDDQNLKFENNLNNKMTTYQKAHIRDLGRTGIVKIDLDSMDISAHANIPGKPLNQFSLDEYENNLRIATTVGEGETANDVYVLDNNLKIIGSVTNLGLTERIYSARFIEDKGYLVTFRQTDPFYVLDLSNPSSPKMSGQLKIPGFSSYLHPINKDAILGVGMENQKVKLSLFDVSDPQNPTEIDKYNLDDYWTEVSNNYHAFLLDPDHKIFFLPGSRGGYIFSYKNNKLEVIKALSETQVKRALYINDFLYIISDNSLTVLSETTWEKVNSLSFD